MPQFPELPDDCSIHRHRERRPELFSTGESQVQMAFGAHHTSELVKAVAVKEIPALLTSQQLLRYPSHRAAEI